MEILDLKFQANNNNDQLTVSLYNISEKLKDMYFGERGNTMDYVKMKLYDFDHDYLSGSFKILYGRYISFTSGSGSNVSNMIDTDTKVSNQNNLPTVVEIVGEKIVLFHKIFHYDTLGKIKDNFSEFVFNIPVEFLYGKDYLVENFKFFLEYDDDDDDITSNDTISFGFQNLSN